MFRFNPKSLNELIEEKLIRHGNRNLYNRQELAADPSLLNEKKLIHLMQLIHQYKKGLEQEIFIQR